MPAPALHFTYAAPAARVVLGAGRARGIAAELDLLGVKRVLVACTPTGARRYGDIISALGTRCAVVFAKAEAHCPQPIADEALEAFVTHRADGIVTIGGGSTIGLGKFIAAKRGAPLLAIPTTLSGSEMTSLYCVKIGNEKRTWNDMAARPRAVIYDPALTETLPAHETAATGMNCLGHCVEALYPAQPNPVARLLALEGIRSLAASLPGVIERNDIASRARALYAGFIGGMLVSMVGIGLHHKICHVIGGHFDVPHGDSNSVILPHVVAFNAPAMPDIAADIAGALGSRAAAEGIADIAARIGAPRSLRELGVPAAGLAAVASEVVAKGTHNPRPMTVEGIEALLAGAWEGKLPPPSNGLQWSKTEQQGGIHVGSATGGR
jgi:alcohol dehydrogenase class IV